VYCTPARIAGEADRSGHTLDVRLTSDLAGLDRNSADSGHVSFAATANQICSAELRNEALERGIRLAVTHDSNIQADTDNFRQRTSHGMVNPVWLVAKRSAAKLGEKQIECE
jgi:hypothetical protein